MFSCCKIPTLVAIDEQSFFDIVDQLYFLLYEGSGSSTNRLTDIMSDKDLEPLWKLKHLRLGARHDIDHGKPTDIIKNNQQVGDAYKYLIGKTIPSRRYEWSQAQVSLYSAFVKMLERVRSAQKDRA